MAEFAPAWTWSWTRGELPGTSSTVLSLVQYEDSGDFEVLREGALGSDQIATLLRDL